MRIAVIGDLQYQSGEEQQILEYFSQIRKLQPDLAVFLGDMGNNNDIGTYEGMKNCKNFLTTLECPFIALMGNHDVEYRPDDIICRTPNTWYSQLFHRSHPWHALEADGIFLLCLSVEQQPANTLMTQHALYISEEQFIWAQEQLLLHQNIPTIIFSHAPMAGSGLRCCPPIHSAATDAYLDHDFQPERFRLLAEKNPQIFLWYSAHFHMGHDYDTAITWSKRIMHISTGVLTSAARDGSRHTRILDIGTQFDVYTLNHNADGQMRWDVSVPLQKTIPPNGYFSIKKTNEVFIGTDHVLKVFNCPEYKRVYITTEYGKLWEYDLKLQEITGAICLNQKIVRLSLANGRLYIKNISKQIISVDLTDRSRFERRSGYIPQMIRQEVKFVGVPLTEIACFPKKSKEGEYFLF